MIGERAFGYRRHNRSGDFAPRGVGNFDTDPNLVDRRMVQTAIEVARRGGFQSMAFDFLLSGDEAVITEISFMFVAWMVHACPGYWTSDLLFHAGPMWPQEAQAADFLSLIRRASTRARWGPAAGRVGPP